MSSRACTLAFIALVALVACDRRDAVVIEPATTTDPTSPAAPAPAPAAAAIPAERRCGEAGEQPTELPPELAGGRTPAGSGSLRPGDRLTLGTVKLHYDPSAWIGTRRAGHHGPALLVEIDRAEVGPHDPWGTHQDLHPEREHHTFVGPYRLDIRTGAGEPPADVAVTVTREVCPASAVIAAAAGPRSLWLSTEGIRTHTYDLHGELLQFNLDGRGDVPRLDISNLGYRHWFEPRPDTTRRFRVADHLITVDRVTPGPGTRWGGGAWQAEGDARLHARVAIDPAVAGDEPAAIAPTSECGDSPARTTIPPVLTVTPPLVATRTLDLGQHAEFGPLRLEYSTLEIPAHGQGPYREEARQIPNLQVFAGALGGQSVTDPRIGGSRIVRIGRELLRVDLDGPGDRLKIRRLTTPCPNEHTLPALQAPVYVWLSPFGRGHVTIPGRGAAPLSLQLHLDPGGPGLALASERAYFSRQLGPDMVGLAYTLVDHLVEVVDVVPATDTTHDGQRWQGGGLLPVVHVQLKVTPQPDGA